MPWLAQDALAEEPIARSETVVQARHDLFGEPIVPLYEFLRVSADQGPLRLDAYVGMSADLPGGPRLSVDALSAEGPWGAARWRVGAQQAVTPVRPQTFDGVWVSGPLGDRRTVLTAWGGRARHDDLDDLAAGTGVGRVELLHLDRSFSLRLAAEGEGGPDGGLIGRQDGELRIGQSRSGWVVASAAVAEDQALELELARAEVGSWIGKRATGSTWIERRRTSVETLLANDVLPLFAPDGYDQGGLRLRWYGADTSSAVGSVGVGRYDWNGEQQTTFLADLAWSPRAGSALPAPSWRFRQGPGGAYHAFSLVDTARLSDALRLTTRGALVPYRKNEDPWRLAATAGLAGAQALANRGWFEVGGDVSSDAVFALDLRAYAALTLDWP